MKMTDVISLMKHVNQKTIQVSTKVTTRTPKRKMKAIVK